CPRKAPSFPLKAYPRNKDTSNSHVPPAQWIPTA
ncbi:unnamed protein product, partial [Allacma fusca]